MKVNSFYHDKPLTESKLYQQSTQSFLFPDLAVGELVRRPMSEIDPDLTRDADVDQTATRLIMVDTSTLIMREAYDFDRLSSKLDIDKVLLNFTDYSLDNILAIQTFDLFDQIEEMRKVEDGDRITIDTVDADLHCALISIGFNDPLDILMYLTTKDDVKYCQVMAISPRPSH